MPLNPRKCGTLRMSMKTTVPTQFFMGGQQVEILEEGDYVKYLGKPVGFRIISPTAPLEEYKRKGLDILNAKLAPWQKRDAMHTFIYPSMTHAMRMGTFKRHQWAEIDGEFMPEIIQQDNQ